MKRIALILLALCAPGVVAMAQVDHSHSAWTALLEKHVVVLDGGKASQVDYTGFAGDRTALQRYLESLSAVPRPDFERWTRAQQLAFLINAYNAFTIEKILTRYPKLKSIHDFGRVFGNPWKDEFFTLFGRALTLDGLEHDTIRVPGAYDDPRVHFALNCAAIGCPMLREEAYVATRLDEQLDEQVVRFLSDRSRNRYDPTEHALLVSHIFDWYQRDFKSGLRGVTSSRAFFARYAPLLADDAAGRAMIRDGKVEIRFLEYDWRLNDAAR